MKTFFVDRTGTLTNKRRTATGGYLVDAVLARTGTLNYPSKGQVHLNTAEALQGNLEALQTVPVTNQHPHRMVDPDTYADVVCGHIVGMPTFKDGKIHATLAINDAQLIEDIESGRAREVSMGYLAHSEEAEGFCDGVKYNRVRTLLDWNHAAIVPAGRAGKDVCLALDSADIPGETEMKLKINGKEVDADKAQASIDAIEMLLENAREEVQEAKDALTAKEAELKTATSDEAIGKLVQAKFDAAEAIKVVDAKRAKVAKHFPKMKDLDKKSAETIETLFDSIAQEEATVDALAPGAAGGEASAKVEEVEAITDAAPKLSARERMKAANRKVSEAKVVSEVSKA